MPVDSNEVILSLSRMNKALIMRQLKKTLDPNGILNPNKTVLLEDSKCIRPPPSGKYVH